MVGISFYGRYFLLCSFFKQGNLDYRIVYTVIAIITLHCYNQLAKIVAKSFKLFYLLQKCLPSYERKKLLVNIVVPKLQETILYDNKGDAQLEPYIVPSVPTFQHCPWMI